MRKYLEYQTTAIVHLTTRSMASTTFSRPVNFERECQLCTGDIRYCLEQRYRRSNPDELREVSFSREKLAASTCSYQCLRTFSVNTDPPQPSTLISLGSSGSNPVIRRPPIADLPFDLMRFLTYSFLNLRQDGHQHLEWHRRVGHLSK